MYSIKNFTQIAGALETLDAFIESHPQVYTTRAKEHTADLSAACDIVAVAVKPLDKKSGPFKTNSVCVAVRTKDETGKSADVGYILDKPESGIGWVVTYAPPSDEAVPVTVSETVVDGGEVEDDQ